MSEKKNEERLALLGKNVLLTDEQRNAVLEDGKVLVSAAAGSGKTSTMLKKLVLMIAEGMDLRRILVLVYNEAAAADLRQRLHSELFDRACQESGRLRERFTEALDSLPFAHISTIHAFCASLLRENFEKLGLSPSFEVLDEIRHDAYKNKALDAVLEQYGAEGDETFFRLADAFAVARKEDNLRNCIVKLFNLIDIQPDRNDFFETMNKCYDSFDDSAFMHVLFDSKRKFFHNAAEQLKIYTELLENCSFEKYKVAAREVSAFADNVLKANDFMEICQNCVGFPTLDLGKRIKGDEYDMQITDEAKAYFKAVEAEAVALANVYASRESLREAHAQNAIFVRELLSIVSDFDKELSKLKAEDNALSFEDLQHKAVELIKQAPEISESFDAIYVDEYQDINPTQEYIISRLIGESSFIVGDIKQSIYGFRLADPTIFLARQRAYKEGGGKALDFNKNFRSANDILRFVNAVFNVVMTEESADVDYKNTAQFVLSESDADHKLSSDRQLQTVQVHLFLPPKRQQQAEVHGLYDITEDIPDDEEEINGEGRFIANEINTLVGHAKIEDRYMRYDDIVVLFRQRSTNIAGIARALREQGIPVDDSSLTQDSSCPEKSLINFLRVIDNPRQDLPLAGYLLSFFGGYDEEELAKLATKQCSCLYDKLLAAANGEDELSAKVRNTLKTIGTYRLKASFKNVSELMNGIVSDYGYDAYVMRDGAVDRLMQFVGSALAKESQSPGEFLEGLSESKAPGNISQGGDRIRFITFHSFKGLEAPVVFLADAGRAFNNEDVRDGLLYMQGNGYIGIKQLDFNSNSKAESLSSMALVEMIKAQQKREELRLMYVALTRAQYLLYVTASVTNKLAEGFGKMPCVSGGKCYMDFISDAIFNGSVKLPYVIHEAQPLPVVGKIRRDFLVVPGDAELKRMISEQRAYEYPHKEATSLAMKYSVSSLDKIDEQTVRVYEQTADIGTAYHRVMQYIDFFVEEEEDVRKELDRLVREELLSAEQREVIRPSEIVACLRSDVMREARIAESKGKCRRELPFMMYKPASSVSDNFTSEDKVLVQGVVDLFIDGDNKIIVDFKYSSLNDAETLKRYKKQLYLYKMAVESAIGAKVDKVLLYSFKTGKVVDAAL